MNCTIDREHELKTQGLYEAYASYKVWIKMIVFGKTKLEELKQSLSEVKEQYEYVNEDGTVEKWNLPKSVDEVKSDIQEMIDNGTKEIEELEIKRKEAFDLLKERNYEHYI